MKISNMRRNVRISRKIIGGIYISIEFAFKKSAMLLFMAAIIISLFAISDKGFAVSGANLALNPSQTGHPAVTASYTCGCDSTWSTVNGIYSYTDNPRDRWTNYGSPNTNDWLALNFGSAKPFNQVKLYIFDDKGGVQPPASYMIQYWNGGEWANVTNQTQTPATPEAFLNTAIFDTVTSDRLRILFTNRNGAYTGLVELEVFLNGSEAVMKDVAVLSAIGDATGYSMKLKVASVLDATYALQANKFQITVNAAPVTASSAVYDPADSSRRTIKLTFPSPVFLNEQSFAVSVQSGACQTSNKELNNAINNIPVIIFRKLDLSLDNRIGISDVVLMTRSPALQVDFNRDGTFNRDDVLILLGQIEIFRH
ncbi:MAG: discoidin protein [Paenibacillus sp.]|nr:discoidin protein [Paenibacillus sp.]